MSGRRGGELCARAGANKLMKKPLSAPELATSLARVLRQ